MNPRRKATVQKQITCEKCSTMIPETGYATHVEICSHQAKKIKKDTRNKSNNLQKSTPIIQSTPDNSLESRSLTTNHAFRANPLFSERNNDNNIPVTQPRQNTSQPQTLPPPIRDTRRNATNSRRRQNSQPIVIPSDSSLDHSLISENNSSLLTEGDDILFLNTVRTNGQNAANQSGTNSDTSQRQNFTRDSNQLNAILEVTSRLDMVINSARTNNISAHQQPNTSETNNRRGALNTTAIPTEPRHTWSMNFFELLGEELGSQRPSQPGLMPGRLMRSVQLNFANEDLQEGTDVISVGPHTYILNGNDGFSRIREVLAHLSGAEGIETFLTHLIQPQGFKKEEIDNYFFTTKFDKSKSKNLDEEHKRCCICICDFEDGDDQRFLECIHRFHTSCIDEWLAKHTTCPICKKDFKE